MIRCAASQDYDSFYQSEILLRRLRGYPPFQDIIVLTASSVDEMAVLRCCDRLRQALDQELKRYAPGGWQVLGPAPAAVAKVNNRYRYRLTLTGPCTREVRRLIAHLIRSVHQDKDNRGVSVYGDWDPYQS